MHILVLGAAGMVGRKLTAALVKSGQLRGQAISRLTLADVIAADKPAVFSSMMRRLSPNAIASSLIQEYQLVGDSEMQKFTLLTFIINTGCHIAISWRPSQSSVTSTVRAQRCQVCDKSKNHQPPFKKLQHASTHFK